MRRVCCVLATVLPTCGSAFAGNQHAGTTPPATGPARVAVRVGTFDARAIALAYYRSSFFAERLRALKAEHDRAKAAGDSRRVEQIEAQGRAEQEMAHRQVFGNEPYDSLDAQLSTIWQAVLDKTDVDVVVVRPVATRDGVQIVDVTGAILDGLHADPKTRDMIRDLNGKVRSGKYDPGQFHD